MCCSVYTFCRLCTNKSIIFSSHKYVFRSEIIHSIQSADAARRRAYRYRQDDIEITLFACVRYAHMQCIYSYMCTKYGAYIYELKCTALMRWGSHILYQHIDAFTFLLCKIHA